MNIRSMLGMAVVAGSLAWGAGQVQAQGRGNFDPEQMRQRMMERYREQLGVKNDDEWKLIEQRIQKVMEAQRDLRSMSGFGFGRRPGGQADDNANRRRFGGEPSPEADALQKAIESNAPADQIKAKLTSFREARKAKEAKLAAARDDLKKVLTSKQEAQAVLVGLLE